MKTIIIFTLSIFYISFANNNYEIKPQRLITDYNGVVYNGERILCYGDYGIITYSDDNGETWKQINIGDEHNIKKIRTNNDSLYGITDDYFLYSKDGNQWIISKISENKPISCTNISHKYFILQKDGLYFSNNKEDFFRIVEFDTSDTYSNLESDSSSIYFVKNNNQLIKMDINDFSTSHVLTEGDLGQFGNYKQISDLQIIENKIYLKIHKFNEEGLSIGINFLYSEIDSSNWEKAHINDIIVKSKTQLIHNNQIYFKYYFNYTLANYLDTQPSHIVKPLIILQKIKNYEEFVSNISSNEYMNDPEYYNIHNFEVSEIIHIKDSTIVLVGENKSILISKDMGKSFKIISWIQKNVIDNTGLSKFDNENIFVMNNKFVSNDSGATFKPELINQDNYTKIFKTDRGELINYTELDNRTIYGYNDHFADYTNFQGINKIIRYDQKKMQWFSNGTGLNKNPLEYDDKYIFTYSDYFGRNAYSVIAEFDKNFNIIGHTKLDSLRLNRVYRISDDTLLTLAYKYSGPLEDYQWANNKYQILESTDDGKTWKEREINLPFDNKMNFYRTRHIFNDKILIFNIYDKTSILYTYDYNKNKLDSINLPANISQFGGSFFEHNDIFYFISDEYKLFGTKNLYNDTINWDTINLSDFLTKWEPFDINNKQPYKNVIFSVNTDSSQLYLTTGTSYESNGKYFFNFNIIILYDIESSTSVVELPHTESRNYLYTYPPYPQPASTEVRSLVYWDTSLEMNKESVKIYNTNGVEVGREQDISFERLNAYSGNLIWNCTNVPDGVYLIQISHGDRKQTIKVMVRK